VALAGDYAYLGNTFGSDLQGGAFVVDISDPRQPSLISYLGGWPHATVYADNGSVFISSYMLYGGDVFVFAARSTMNMVQLGTLGTGVLYPWGLLMKDMAFAKGYGYAVYADEGLFIYDLRGLLSTNLRFTAGEASPTATWDLGTLQFSPAVNGPWTDLPAASPFPLSPIGDKGFFRVRVED